MKTLISREVTAPPYKSRKGKVAVVGEGLILHEHLEMLAPSIVTNLPTGCTVYTVSTDYLGHCVRLECKRRGIKTFNYKVQEVSKEPDTYSLVEQQELIIARMAWKVETFYCLYDPEIKTHQSKDCFSRLAMSVCERMNKLLNCKTLVYNHRIFQ